MTDKQIAAKILRCRKDAIIVAKKYADANRKIADRIAKIRKNCPHRKTTRFPDASGNNGSWIECDTCGAEV